MLFGGVQYPLGLNTTWSTGGVESAPAGFDQYAMRLLKSNPVVFAAAAVRIAVFSQARLVWQQRRSGRVVNQFTDRGLSMFQRPWPGGTTSDLLARMELHNTVAGNAFVLLKDGRLHLMRPDWVTIVMGSRLEPEDAHLGEDAEVVAYWYRPSGGTSGRLYTPDQVAHFAPQPDPSSTYRGMSWLTPVLRDVQGDTAASEHKLKFFENAATPNLLVTFDQSLTQEKVKAFKTLMEESHQGAVNAYKTLYLGGGADATVIGKDLQQLDFAVTQGKGETRIAMASGVHPVVLGASEGLQGSSLNAGNYTAAKRSFSDVHLQHLWMNAVASLSVLADDRRDQGVELWFDKSEIPFLQDDLKDTAEVQGKRATAIRTLTDGGYTPESVVQAVVNDDLALLEHTQLLPVQLQAPGSGSEQASLLPDVQSRSLPPTFNVNLPEQRFDIGVPEVHVQVEGVDVHVPEQRQDVPQVTVHVEPTPVNIENRVDVDVDPTPVTVENQVDNRIDVQPAPVTVIEADGPSRYQVRRDKDGKISEVVERD